MLQGVRSVVFVIQMYAVMALMAVFVTPFAGFSRRIAHFGVHMFTGWVRLSARWIVGLDSEVRGEVPQDEVLIVSKHQSFFDVILLCSALPRPKFIMKSELRWVPIVGWYALWIGCIPVDRGKRGKAIRQMVDGVEKDRRNAGQLIIYPQGTRVAPGAYLPYKLGSGVLYKELGQPCVPVATNVGVFWPKRGFYRKPGKAVIEFLPTIPPGLETRAFMERLETEIEGASNRLMQEAGFPIAPPPPGAAPDPDKEAKV